MGENPPVRERENPLLQHLGLEGRGTTQSPLPAWHGFTTQQPSYQSILTKLPLLVAGEESLLVLELSRYDCPPVGLIRSLGQADRCPPGAITPIIESLGPA